MHRIVVLALLCGCCLAATQGDEKNDDREERLLLANYATTTQLTLSFVTSTVPVSCLTAVTNTACKRRRRSAMPLEAKISDGAHGEIDSSKSDASVKKVAGKRDSVSRDDRKFFTVWNTAFSTGTATTTITNTAVTVSLSLGCLPSDYPYIGTC